MNRNASPRLVPAIAQAPGGGVVLGGPGGNFHPSFGNLVGPDAIQGFVGDGSTGVYSRFAGAGHASHDVAVEAEQRSGRPGVRLGRR
jgi:hypothetical protein